MSLGTAPTRPTAAPKGPAPPRLEPPGGFWVIPELALAARTLLLSAHSLSAIDWFLLPAPCSCDVNCQDFHH